MEKFDTKVQRLKYSILREVARLAWEDSLLENVSEIPKMLIPGKKPTMRCCIHKERAILSERVRLAVGGNRYNKKVIQVIDIACEDCPAGGYEVTPSCRGCLSHRCVEVCRRGAIRIGEDQKAVIDKTLCVECGACARICPYNAIHNYKRPCESACRVGAIHMGEEKEACIDYDKCIACGACVYTCPFGAITDRSYILDVIDLIRNSDGGKNYPLFALVAPSIASQFTYARPGQILSAIRALGFTEIREVALGADMVAAAEARELEEQGFLTSSCCPAFVAYVEKNFPELKMHISHNLSPAGTLARAVRERYPNAHVVFIGPCTAKKAEFQREEYRGLFDSVITFEELQALIDSRSIAVEELPDTKLEQASSYGRIFARSGGVASAVCRALGEAGSDFAANPISCSGIDECRAALMRAAHGVLPQNFIEGMACVGGCVNGAGSLTHDERARAAAERHAESSPIRSISDSLANDREKTNK